MTTRTRTDRLAAVTAAAGALAALGYGALKAIWALGGTLGVNGTPPWVEDMPGWQHFLAFWGTVILAVAAAALVAALVSPWGRSRRPLRALAWLGAVLLTPVGLIGTAQSVAGIEGDPTLSPAVYAFVYGSFLTLGLAFASTAWLTRRRYARERVRAPHLAGARAVVERPLAARSPGQAFRRSR